MFLFSAALNKKDVRMFKCLKLLFCLVISGYFAIALLRQLIPLLFIPFPNLNGVLLWDLITLVGVPVNISAAASAPVLYKFSHEYRKAFNKEFKCLERFS